ncbi:MAG: hypothetical protein ISS31_00650 [Kiritimatiellae bacterium]|nr:hypothetical protein [Kiritimatiellia bacterium]
MKNIMRMGMCGVAAIVTAAIVMGVCGVGCDTVTDSKGTITFTTPLMTVTGRYAIVVTVTDTNGTLFLPLRWSVSEPSLGTVNGQGALTALYEGNARVGINEIRVKDQANAEGYLVVNHLPATGIDLTPQTNSIHGAAGAQMQFTVAPDPSLALPLIWTSHNEGLGVFVSFGLYNAVYQTTGHYGDNFVTVTDQMGASATAIVYHR